MKHLYQSCYDCSIQTFTLLVIFGYSFRTEGMLPFTTNHLKNALKNSLFFSNCLANYGIPFRKPGLLKSVVAKSSLHCTAIKA